MKRGLNEFYKDNKFSFKESSLGGQQQFSFIIFVSMSHYGKPTCRIPQKLLSYFANPDWLVFIWVGHALPPPSICGADDNFIQTPLLTLSLSLSTLSWLNCPQADWFLQPGASVTPDCPARSPALCKPRACLTPD